MWQHEIEIYFVFVCCRLALLYSHVIHSVSIFIRCFCFFFVAFFLSCFVSSTFGECDATVNTFVWHKWTIATTTTAAQISKRMTSKRRKLNWRNEQRKHIRIAQLMCYVESASVKSAKRKTFSHALKWCVCMWSDSEIKMNEALTCSLAFLFHMFFFVLLLLLLLLQLQEEIFDFIVTCRSVFCFGYTCLIVTHNNMQPNEWKETCTKWKFGWHNKWIRWKFLICLFASLCNVLTFESVRYGCLLRAIRLLSIILWRWNGNKFNAFCCILWCAISVPISLPLTPVFSL